MTKVTKEMLDQALDAWYVARERAGLEMQAWGALTQSHGSLIASLRQNGHTWARAEAEFEMLSKAHAEAVQAAWKNMDDLCSQYRKLLAMFKSQS